MREIYRNAHQVILWLGAATPQSNVCLQGVRRLGAELIQSGCFRVACNQLLQQTADNDDGSNPPTKTIVDMFINEQALAALRDEDSWWWFVSDLGKRDWWKRIWCIQELANARIATFKCGHEEVDFRHYVVVAFVSILLEGHLARSITAAETPPALDVSKAIRLAHALRGAFPSMHLGIRQRILQSEDWDLHRLLLLSSVLDALEPRGEATDPRDRVYGLLGLAKDSAARDIIADYTVSCEDAYIMTTKVMMRHGYDSLLSLCRRRDSCKDLPSWCPDWTAPNRMPWSMWVWENERMFNASDTIWNADAPLSLIYPEDNIFSRHITVDAATVDTVKDTGHIWSFDSLEKINYEAARHYMDDISRYLSESRIYNSTQKEAALWRLPIGDIQLTRSLNQVQRAFSVSGLIMGYRHLRRMIDEGEAVFFQADILDVHFSATYMAQMRRMYDSRPFVSTRGYVGICPMETQPGDVITIIKAARVPYILRKEKGVEHWKLVGESHVYGIMDGEFMRQEPIPTFEAVVIC